MNNLWYAYPLAILAGILAGVINTLAGSCSLVTLPMLIALGLPSHMANATNRVGVAMQNIVGITTFQRSGKFNLTGSWWLIAPTIPGALVGAWLATQLGQQEMDRVIGAVMVIMLFVILFDAEKWLREKSEVREGRPSLLTLVYVGYAPAGVALLVQVSTDNRNRSSSDVRTAFSKNGGNIAEPGAVAWQFARRGVVSVPKKHAGKTTTEDDLMLTAVDAGAEDIIDNGDDFELRCGPTDIGAVCHALVEAGIHFDSADRPMVANTVISVTNEADARKILKMIDALEDLDDVEEVFSNFDISEDLFATLSA